MRCLTVLALALTVAMGASAQTKKGSCTCLSLAG